MNWQPYDPLEHKAVINFKLGPQGFKIPEPRAQSEEFPSPSQLYIIFTDIRNLCASTVKDQISIVEEEGGEDLNNINSSVSPGFRDILPPPTDILPEDGLKMDDSPDHLAESNTILAGDKKTSQGALIDFASLEKVTLDEIIQLFRYRVKNNSLGMIHYLPEKWNGRH
jgi:hypothetical protein